LGEDNQEHLRMVFFFVELQNFKETVRKICQKRMCACVSIYVEEYYWRVGEHATKDQIAKAALRG
jgi:hypothetical protein